jgi:SNF2 family DNA or RNA helicase
MDASITATAAKWWSFLMTEPNMARSFSGLQTTPWKHQPGAIDFGVRCPSPYFDMGMGTGKSLVTIGTLTECGHKLTLVICPKAVVDVWPREFRKHSRGQFIVAPLPSKFTAEKKMMEVKKLIASRPSEPIVIVANYDAVTRAPLADYLTGFKWDCVVADEAHRLKSHSGVQSKFAGNLCKGHAIALSGTMLPHDPLDVFAQYRFLDAAIFGTSFTMFKQRYCKTDIYGKPTKFIEQDEMNERINTIRHYVPSSVLGLAKPTHQFMSFDLSPKLRKAYDEFKRELIVEFKNGVMVADNALVRGLRLQQITSGFFVDDNTKQIVELDDKPKAAAFEDWLDAVPRNAKAVVFCRFKHDVEIAKRIIEKDGRVYGELSGSRNDLVPGEATFPPHVDILVANISSGGVGVDLTLANYACYYSISWNRGEYDQSIARLVRPGQTKHCHFTHLVAADTVDCEVYDAFESGRDIVEAVLNGLRLFAT